jgi:WD40 repeat protein
VGGGLRLFDVKTSKVVIDISDGVEGTVRSVTFNENGFWTALACDSGVQVWDLRKATQAVALVPFEDGPATCVSWDYSGKYLVRHLGFIRCSILTNFVCDDRVCTYEEYKTLGRKL